MPSGGGTPETRQLLGPRLVAQLSVWAKAAARCVVAFKHFFHVVVLFFKVLVRRRWLMPEEPTNQDTKWDGFVRFVRLNSPLFKFIQGGAADSFTSRWLADQVQRQ